MTGEALDARIVETQPVAAEQLQKIRDQNARMELAAQNKYQDWVREHQASVKEK